MMRVRAWALKQPSSTISCLRAIHSTPLNIGDPKSLSRPQALLLEKNRHRTLVTLKSAKKPSERFAGRFAMQGPDDGCTVLETHRLRQDCGVLSDSFKRDVKVCQSSVCSSSGSIVRIPARIGLLLN